MFTKEVSPFDCNPSRVKRSVDCVEDVAYGTDSMDTSNDLSESVKRNKTAKELSGILFVRAYMFFNCCRNR